MPVLPTPHSTSEPTAASAPTSATEPTEGVVIVHVAGAVLAPGVIELPAGSRVNDAVLAAGGPTADADLAAVNLAGRVEDGQQIYLPTIGEQSVRPGAAPTGSGGAPALIDLNTADATALESLPGIGPALAGRILSWREEHGNFLSVDGLTDVPGIGPATMERLRELVTA